MFLKYFIYIFVTLYIKCLAAQSEHKSSVAFVIDDTGSMGDDIAQVKRGVKEIFDTVLNHKTSQIENFILVTFNDRDTYEVPPAPGIRERAITKDYFDFMAALTSIHVSGGGGDCYEYAMSGIYRALEISLPGSYLYVFTDVTAKDYKRFEEVKSLALKKLSQVVFVLTGTCDGTEDAPDYQVYYDTARATNGAVFNLETEEMGQILDYVKISIEGRRTTLTAKSLPPGWHKISFNVDPEIMNPVTISIESRDTNISVEFMGPDGNKLPRTELVSTKTNKMYSVNVSTPGLYIAEVNTTAKMHIVVAARSDINFQHGFSTFKPSSIDSTSTKPVPDVESYVSIKLIEGDVELKTVKILDTSGIILEELPLAISDEKTKFYVSTRPFVPPNTIFRVEITAYDPKNNSNITRTALTPVEVQKILPGVTILDKTASVVIEGDAKIYSEYDEPLQLICKVNGYPKPDIVWNNKHKGINLSGKESISELPYDYVSILTIEKVKENATYECKASNTYNSDSKVVDVETTPKPHYFTVLDLSEKVNIEYETEGQLHCLVDAYPPVEIKWYKNGSELSSGGNIELSSNNSTVTIKYTTPSDGGNYLCEARNEDTKKNINKYVTVVGVESPVIDKNVTEVTVKSGSTAVIECKLLQGKPKASITWFYGRNRTSINPVKEWEGKETISMENTSTQNTGAYQCQAENEISKDNHEINLIVEFPASIAPPEHSKLSVLMGSKLKLPCKAEGLPEPEIKWTYKSFSPSAHAEKLIKTKGEALYLEPVQLSQAGFYTCIARNSGGTENITYTIEVTIPDKTTSVDIEGEAKIHAEYYKPLQLICKVNGYPKPDIVWNNKKKGTNLSGKESVLEHPYDYVSILKIEKVKENATYECKASNPSGSDAKVVAVETIPKPHYFKVLDLRRNVNISFGKEGQIHCLVDAYPPVEITWYKYGKKLSSGGNIELSHNKSTVKIKNTTYSDRGKYMCEARNEDTTKQIKKVATVVGVESPVIDKDVTEIAVPKGSSAVIECKMLQGKPKPSISWFYGTAVASDSGGLDPLEEWMEKETVVVDNVSTHNSGTYRCRAKNDISSDHHDINLIFERLPTIAKDKMYIKTVVGSEISMSCNVDGAPKPNVTWFKDGVEITNSDEIQIFWNQNLKLQAVKPSDSGNYTCKAVNRLGGASRTVIVEVFIPVSITLPENSTLSVLVGSKLTLPCKAEGLPEPKIQWIYNSFSPSTLSEKKIKTKGEALHLERVQLSQAGFYTCIARNSEGTANITYTIHVFAPPVIENTYIDTHFFAVKGDLALRITCKAIGSPKPAISWTKDGWNLVLGSTYYEEEGTLIIINVPTDAQGIYKCEAENVLGSAQEIYEVSVTEYPTPGRVSSSIWIEKGKPAEIKCNIPHTRIDQLRWFKNGKLISTDELALTNPSMTDSGYYICRVSDFFKTISENVRINVGYKPTFTSEEDLDIEMVNGTPVSLFCETRSEPKPDVSWYCDSKILNETSPVLNFHKGINSPGQYKCEVQNIFGTISRTFTAVPRDCFVNINNLTKLQPLMVTSSQTWPEFDRFKEFMIFQKGVQFELFCPNDFKLFPKKNITAFCDGGTDFMINGRKYDYADIQCTEEVTHVVQRTGESCMLGNTEKFIIEYKVLGDETIEVYEICMDNTNNVPLYTMHVMLRSLADDEYKTIWSDSDQFLMNFEDLYNCKTQTETISSRLSKLFHNTDECCFSKRQLVNPRDVFPGVAQRSTFSYLNVLPHWGTCNADNWDDIELRVRNFAKNSNGELLVWTGGAKQLALTSGFNDTKNQFFTDRRGNRQPVPIFLWKVIQDPESQSSLAIVQVNVPDLLPSEVYKYTLCGDICDDTDWMKSPKWHDVESGYTYCCTLPEFERAFGFEDVFDTDMNEILR